MDKEFKPVLMKDYFRHVIAVIMVVFLIPVICGIKPGHELFGIFYTLVCAGWVIYTSQVVVKIRLCGGNVVEFITFVGKTKVNIKDIKKVERIARFESLGGSDGSFKYYIRFITPSKTISVWYDGLEKLTSHIAEKNPEAVIEELTKPYCSEFYSNKISTGFWFFMVILVVLVIFVIMLALLSH